MFLDVPWGLKRYQQRRCSTGRVALDHENAELFDDQMNNPSLRKKRERLGTRLWDEYRIEVPLVRCKEREFLRVSIQAYNSTDEIERLVDALKTLL